MMFVAIDPGGLSMKNQWTTLTIILQDIINILVSTLKSETLSERGRVLRYCDLAFCQEHSMTE